MTRLTLKRAPIGPNQEYYDVLAEGAVWAGSCTSGAARRKRRHSLCGLAYGYHRDCTPTYGYEATRRGGLFVGFSDDGGFFFLVLIFSVFFIFDFVIIIVGGPAVTAFRP